MSNDTASEDTCEAHASAHSDYKASLLKFWDDYHMFGYVTIDKLELKFKDYYLFRSYYCGVCRDLKKQDGNVAQATLGYDMTFLALLLSGLYDTQTTEESFRCVAHPFSKRTSRRNEFTSFAADMNLLMVYHKCLDDWIDEKKYTRRIYAALISRRVKRVEKKYPEKAAAIAGIFEEERRFEQSTGHDIKEPVGCDIDESAAFFGRVMAELFSYKDDMWREDLHRMGFFLGKYIYLLDAYDDIYEDARRGSYNPFAEIYEEPDFDTRVEEILRLMISDSALAFERLPIDENMEILRNIIYSGIWKKFEDVKAKRTERKEI